MQNDSAELHRVIAELRQSQSVLEARQLMETSAARLTDLMRWQPGDTLSGWGDRVLADLAEVAGGLQACLYMRAQAAGEEPELRLVGAFATSEEHVLHSVRFGEGLLGQTAKSGRMQCFEGETLTQATTHTGLTVVRPKALILQPLTYQGTVQGVLEISSAKPFDEYQLDLIRRVAEDLAASLMGIRSQEQMRRLYQEAQEKSEQLAAQEEEMRQNLEEMQATQEEMRRVQQAVLEAKQYQEKIFENTDGIIISCDPAGTLRYLNTRALNLLGYERHELVDVATPARFHDPEEMVAEARRLSEKYGQPVEPGFGMFTFEPLRGERYVREWTYITKDGRRVAVELAVTLVRGADGAVQAVVGLGQDITERKKAEAEILKTMEDLTAVSDSLKATQQELSFQIAALNNAAIVSETDVRGTITFVNETFCRISQYTPEEMIGQNHRILRHPDMPAEVFEDLWKTITAGKVWRGNVKNRRKDGGYYWVHATVTPLLGDNGRPRKYISVRFDITEEVAKEEQMREQTVQLAAQEEELRQNLEELQAMQDELMLRMAQFEQANRKTGAILNASHDPIIAINGRGIIQMFNRAAERAFGYTEAEAVGMKVDMLMPEPHSSAHDGYMERYRQTGEPRVIGRMREVEGLRKDGTRFPVTLAVNEVEVEGERLYVGILQDISWQKEREAELAERVRQQEETQKELLLQHDLYAALLDSSRDTFLALDKEFRVLLLNQQMRANYKKAGIDPQAGDRIFDFHKPEQHEMFMGLYSRVLGGESFNRVIDIPEQDIFLRAAYFPLKNAQGEIFGIGIVGTDMMEIRKMLEETKVS